MGLNDESVTGHGRSWYGEIAPVRADSTKEALNRAHACEKCGKQTLERILLNGEVFVCEECSKLTGRFARRRSDD